jgi:hypothetical protein
VLTLEFWFHINYAVTADIPEPLRSIREEERLQNALHRIRGIMPVITAHCAGTSLKEYNLRVGQVEWYGYILATTAARCHNEWVISRGHNDPHATSPDFDHPNFLANSYGRT